MKKEKYTVNKHHLSNSLPLLVINGFETQSVTIMILTGTGSRHEIERLSGQAHFLEHMFFKGSSMYPDSNQLAMAIELLGGLSNAFTSYDYTGYYIKVPKKNYKKALQLLADVIINPVFKQEEFEKERGVISEEIKMYNDLPYELIKDEFNKNLFSGHALGRNIAGTLDSIKNIDQKSLSEFRAENYSTENMQLVITGDVSLDESVEFAEKYFGPYKNRSLKKHPDKYKKPSKLKRNYLHIKKETEQAHIVIGGLCYRRNDALEFPLKVGMTLLTDGFGSRLFQNLREKHGIAYYLAGGVATYEDVGKYYIRAGIATDNIEKGVELIIQALKDISFGRFSDLELERAKNYYIASVLEGIETGEDKASWFGINTLLGKRHKNPEDQIKELENVSRDLLIESWKGIISDNNLLISLIAQSGLKDVGSLTSLD